MWLAFNKFGCMVIGWLGKGAQEVDQQWINSGAKQCSQRLYKKISLPICFFLEQTK